jgi:predicted ribosomally synthesized peptide with nif11-like leader
MSLASLEAFLERVHDDPGLQEVLADAPDAAAVAAIARAAGFPVSELDLWRATAATPDDLAPAAEALQPAAEADQPVAEPTGASSAAPPPSAAERDAKAAKAPVGRLPDPWLAEEEPLTRFVHQAQGDAELRQALATAPDAAAVASIAQAAGYPISEVDLWLASGTNPDELAASLRPREEAGISTDAESPFADDQPKEADRLRVGEGPAGVASPITGDGPADADRSLASPSRSADADGLFLEEEPFAADAPSSSGTAWPEETLPAEPAATGPDALSPQAAAEELIRQFLRQAEADAELRQALASAPDAAAVAAIAQAAGHPLSELALWLASGAAFEEAQTASEPPSPADDPLTLFLRAVEVDPDLQTALASAPDATTVAAIARIAGFPLTAADLWAASDAVPQELEVERWLVDEVFVEELVVEERVILGR